MANITVTRANVIAKALELEDVWSEEELEVLSKMYASITKPRKNPDLPTKTQVINAALAHDLIEVMKRHGSPVTAKWIAENLAGVDTPQKAVAVVKAAGEKVVKFYEQRTAYYRLAE